MLPQLVVTATLFIQPKVLPYEGIVAAAMLALQVVELVVAVPTTRAVVHANTQRWRLRSAFRRSRP